MSDDIIISVENLGKRYSLRHLRDQRYVALRDVLVEKATGLFRRNGRGRAQKNLTSDLGPLTSDLRASKEDFWALRGVSFEVRRGEVVGIIGRNGAGKSTLLKILSRITEPTEGRVKLKGRVASLLEVGTGFHPELTGRENIYLNGAILGMHRAEIKAKFDEIVAFAETEKFLDTPVKRYSSGMYVRLAFAVAAHLEPEILVIDEVLAVGDAEFQKKCLGKMREVAEGHGRTVLFVSHNMVAVNNFCRTGIHLDAGTVALRGSAQDVVQSYLRSFSASVTERSWSQESAPGDELFKLLKASVRSGSPSQTTSLSLSTPIVFEFDYLNLERNACLNLCAYIINQEGSVVLVTVPLDEPIWFGKPHPKGRFRSSFTIPEHFLNDGAYSIRLMVVHGQSRVNLIIEDLLQFEIIDDQPRTGYQGKWHGVVRPRLEWETQFLDGTDNGESSLDVVLSQT